MGSGRDEVGFNMFYSIISLKVDKCKSECKNEKDAYPLGVEISTSNAPEKEKRAL